MDKKIILIAGAIGLYAVYKQSKGETLLGDIPTGTPTTPTDTGITNDLRLTDNPIIQPPTYNLFVPQTALSQTRFISSGDAVYDRFAQQTISKPEASNRYTSSQIQNLFTPKVYPQSIQQVPTTAKKQAVYTPPTKKATTPSIISQLPSFKKGNLIFPTR